MKQRSLLILSFIALLFASCGKNKSGNSGLMVPKDAAIVIHINSASLASKLSWNEIKATNWFKKLQGEAESQDTLAQRLLNDPSQSGVDTKKDFVMYIKKHGRGGYMVVQGSLTSRATYEQMLAEMNKKKPKEIKKHGDFNYITGNDESVVLWNKSMFAMVTNANMPNFAEGMMGRKGSRSGNFEFDVDSLRLFGEQALTLEGGQNLDTDSRFADLVKDGSDVHLWMNIGAYMPAGMGNAMMSMMKLNVLFEDNITAMSLNFDNGKISAKTKHYFGEQMDKIYANNKPENVKAEVINRIPSADPVAVMAFNYSPKGLKEVLKVIGIDAMADMFLAKVNFSLDDFVKANKGEVVLSISDPVVKMDTMKYGGMTKYYPAKPDMKILFATSVNDKVAFEKMVSVIWDFAKQYKKDKEDDSKPAISYKLENNWFAISNSKDYTDKFLAGGNNKFAFTDKITGHPIGIYVDLQRIMKLSAPMATDSSSKAALDASLNMWQDVTAKGGDYKNKSSEFEFEINLVDKNTNSLKQLNQYIDKMAASFMDKHHDMADEMNLRDLKIQDVEEKEAPPAPKEK